MWGRQVGVGKLAKGDRLSVAPHHYCMSDVCWGAFDGTGVAASLLRRTKYALSEVPHSPVGCEIDLAEATVSSFQARFAEKQVSLRVAPKAPERLSRNPNTHTQRRRKRLGRYLRTVPQFQ